MDLKNEPYVKLKSYFKQEKAKGKAEAKKSNKKEDKKEK